MTWFDGRLTGPQATAGVAKEIANVSTSAALKPRIWLSMDLDLSTPSDFSDAVGRANRHIAAIAARIGMAPAVMMGVPPAVVTVPPIVPPAVVMSADPSVVMAAIPMPGVAMAANVKDVSVMVTGGMMAFAFAALGHGRGADQKSRCCCYAN
jgi:hypothetical protein